MRAGPAQKNHEYRSGIEKIWGATDAPTAVARFLELVERYNPSPELTRYPGSPWLAQVSLRAADQLFFFELHPAEHRSLLRECGDDPRIKVSRADGLAGVIGLVPPPSRRALVLIDPSYETRDESQRVVDTVAKLHRRFATGVIAIWYPLIESRAVQRFERSLRGVVTARMATYELVVTPRAAHHRLRGSAMILINPPWKLDDEMRSALPWLAATLADGDKRDYRISATND